MIDIYEAGISFDRSRWQGEAGRCVLIEFSDRDVEVMTHGQLKSLNLKTHHELFDDRLSRLTFEIENATLFENPGGELYIQGLCVALLGALSNRYSAIASPDDKSALRKLSSVQQRRLTDLIKQEFSTKLSLSRLAGEVRLSPQHFARLFKTTFGVTAHEYVLQVRIDAAVEALRAKRYPSISDAALACGFSSHSHMTDILRRRLGITPSDLQRQYGR
jgi:AraC family transcriptional regulator